MKEECTYEHLLETERIEVSNASLQYTAGDPISTRSIKASDIADLRRWIHAERTASYTYHLEACPGRPSPR